MFIWKLKHRTNAELPAEVGDMVDALKVAGTQPGEALRAHPGVSDAAVFGIPDDRLGQRVAALIECFRPALPALQTYSVKRETGSANIRCPSLLELFRSPRETATAKLTTVHSAKS